jgi:hypothetical protein
MKKLVLAIAISFVSFVATSQVGISAELMSIWNKYRKDNELGKANCKFQSYKVVQVTPNQQFYVMWVDEKKDTSYHWATVGGAEKVIPKYHNKNTSLILRETLHTRDYNGYVVLEDRLPRNWRSIDDFDAHAYMDSLYIQDLFDGLANSELYGGLFLSDREFYVDFDYNMDADFQGKTYTLKLYEMVDVSGLHLPADYGHSFFASEIERYKVFALNPKTKKLLYPELSEKQNKKKGKR